MKKRKFWNGSITVAITVMLSFLAVEFASAQVPFNRAGSVAGAGVINGYNYNSSSSAVGVYGLAASSLSTAGFTYGVFGQSNSPKGRGVVGIATKATGPTIGVFGQSNSPKGRGVVGITTKATGPTIGVFGLSKSVGGKGVYGRNTSSGYAGYFDGKFGVKGIMRMIPHTTSPNIIGGDQGNSVTNGVYGSTISGGGVAGMVNKVTDIYGTIGGGLGNQAGNGFGTNADTGFATVGGGINNKARGLYSTVGGGKLNIASGTDSTVAGGDLNSASGNWATVAGGEINRAIGRGSVVPGGLGNTARGEYGFAAGRYANATHLASLVWSDSTTTPANRTNSTGPNSVTFRASGGVTFYTAAAPNTIVGSVLASGSGTWAGLSDRNSKENIDQVDGRDVLDKLAMMKISSWNYKTQDKSIRHIGPMAQDFYSAYGMGPDERRITTIDADGVALAAIQGLYNVVKDRDAEIAELRSRLLALEKKLD